MDRRAFVAGVFGLAIIGVGSKSLVSQGAVSAQGANAVEAEGRTVFTTAATTTADAAIGPVMHDGIDIVELADGYVGRFGQTDLFNMDEVGAALVMHADGSRSIREISLDAAASLGMALDPADVASFFVALGQAGYLQNKVLVNFMENPA